MSRFLWFTVYNLFAKLGSCNSIFLYFCMFYAPFNISGTLEASAKVFIQHTQVTGLTKFWATNGWLSWRRN